MVNHHLADKNEFGMVNHHLLDKNEFGMAGIRHKPDLDLVGKSMSQQNECIARTKFSIYFQFTCSRCGNADHYCMCTPNLAIDLVIVSGSNNEFFWLVRRRDTNQLATMGGFVEVDESVENAVRREIKEEMDIDLEDPPQLVGLYSDPRRDNRRRTVSAVYAVHLGDDVHPKAGDDAKEVKRISIHDIEQHEYFADHRTILLDYRRFLLGQSPVLETTGDFATDVVRSTCFVGQKL
jgi:8-oxo-dGTP diphosphatase